MKRLRREVTTSRTRIPPNDLRVDGHLEVESSSSKHNKRGRTSIALFTLAAGTILAAILGLLRGRFSFGVSTRHNFVEMGKKCEEAAVHLKSQNINLLALDFDLTVIDRHTGGRWKGTSEELSEHVRPEIQCLLNSAFNRKINAAIVTFSEQIDLIANVTGQIFPGQHIPVHGWYTASGGKQGHLVRAINDINMVQGSEKISNETTILIDDDKRNIKKARNNGFGTIWYDPEADRSMFLIESIISN